MTLNIKNCFRSENKQFLQIALSETAKLKRRRIGNVNIQMTVISWLLEFFTGLGGIVMAVQSQKPDSDINFIACIWLLDAFLNFIVIPSSYLMNNEVNKTMIIAEGWCRLFSKRMNANKVEPAKNNVKKPQVHPDPQPAPIRSISGNVQALSSQRMDLTMENLNKDFMMLTANNLFCEP